jgi:ABC-2 type transport system permease protein
MTGFTILFRKELAESWRTLRLPIVAGLFLGLGILSPVTARYLREIVNAVAPAGVATSIPPPTVGDAVDQVTKNIGQFGALAAILITMGAVAAEKERGTAAFLLVKPVGRGAFLAAKAAAVGLILAIAALLGTAVAWAYTSLLFELQPIGGWAILAGVLWLSTASYAAITFLGSVVVRSALPAAGIGFAGLIVLAIVSAIGPLAKYVPPGLLGEVRGVVTSAGAAFTGGAAAPSDDLPLTIACSLAIMAVCLAGAWAAFRRQEL